MKTPLVLERKFKLKISLAHFQNLQGKFAILLLLIREQQKKSKIFNHAKQVGYLVPARLYKRFFKFSVTIEKHAHTGRQKKSPVKNSLVYPCRNLFFYNI